MSMEDIGVIRSIPNMVIVEPCDSVQLVKALPAIVGYPGTVYLRLWRLKLDPIFDEDYKFDLMKADCLKKGNDLTIFASGYMVSQTIKAERILKNAGIDAEIINIHTIKPIDKECIEESVRRTGAAVVCENHNVIGGLGSAVAEVVTRTCPVPMEFVGVQDRFGQVGDLDFLTKEYQMTPEDIVAQCCKVLKRKRTNG